MSSITTPPVIPPSIRILASRSSSTPICWARHADRCTAPFGVHCIKHCENISGSANSSLKLDPKTVTIYTCIHYNHRRVLSRYLRFEWSSKFRKVNLKFGLHRFLQLYFSGPLRILNVSNNDSKEVCYKTYLFTLLFTLSTWKNRFVCFFGTARTQTDTGYSNFISNIFSANPKD